MAISPVPASPSDAREATILVFGGHIGSQSKQSLEKPIRQILEGPNAKWILDTVAGLPRYWDALIERIPEVASTVDGVRVLAEFDSWLRKGTSSSDLIEPDADLPDLLLGPLMVAIQLDQYWQYLEYRLAGANVDDLQAELVRQQNRQCESGGVKMLGFCAGLIGASAVASSHDRQGFEKYGAVALRIGMLMAALVGAREVWDKGLGKGGSVSLAIAWRSPRQAADMADIVSSLSPDAYVSVLFDDTRATVTTSERGAPTLVRRLRAAGVTAIPLAFKGHLHTPGEERKRHTDAVIQMCHEMPELQFPEAGWLALPIYGNDAEGKPVSTDEVDMAGLALRSILVHQFNWTSIVSKVTNRKDASLVAFGLDRCVPPTIVRRLGPKQVHFEDLESYINRAEMLGQSVSSQKMVSSSQQPHPNDTGRGSNGPEGAASRHDTEKASLSQAGLMKSAEPRVELEKGEEEIAIVGMSIKVAGADDVEEFAEMLKTGASQHEVITRQRMMHDMIFRENADADPKKKYYGNFVRDSDAFDHKFFKRSPRESQAMDPQSRLSLQVAYQAVEQSGYFTEMVTTSTATHEKRQHVGVYVGLCGVDYEQNIASHSPSAFTATGGLRSFIAGKVSHYFGWTGPSMTFDTACSSSTVAIHTACRNILSGEATAALCGGVNVMTNLQWIQNLSAGSFLSPTGQCKPFDADADGYCRAEGVAFVFLKKLSNALADGNTVLGTIRATAVYQNLNVTPLFVPNVPSLSKLFKDVIRKSCVDPRDISLVEAHGTGTPVGDPAEYESVRLAVAGPLRDTVVPIGSVKGHIGHTEGASGVIALVKILMMMRGNFIPPQANFKTMNPHIHAQPADMMEVVTSLRPWLGDQKFALLNNYGACGSNASMVIGYSAHEPFKTLSSSSSRFPFRIAGLDSKSIATYSTALALYLCSHNRGEGRVTLADISFNMNRQSNPSLPQGLIFSCSSLAELQDKLSQASSSVQTTGIAAVKPERPVILCFGGQVSTFIGLDRALYDNAAVFRHHLDECDAAITSLGLSSIYPDIFSRSPMKDTVKLQIALFAMQYASAKSWMDCGLASKVVSLVGHSFGEITALCVAGVLSLEDTVKLVAGRARIVRDDWGSDSGAMMAVEADEARVHDLLKEVNLKSDGSVSIACYNGPRSFTLAGSTEAIDAVTETIARGNWLTEGVKSKRLNVTNAFHSVLVEKLMDKLGDVGRDLTFNDAPITIERATEHGDSAARLDWSFVGSHMRKPVFFNHAVQRLATKHPQAIFLEAGSNSTITIMASHALSQVAAAIPGAFHFQSVSITNTDKGIDGLTDATVSLWKQGLRLSFWAHHAMQANEYERLLLPPYQFEKSRHWLDIKSPTEVITKAAQDMIAAGNYGVALGGESRRQDTEDRETLGLWTFVGFQDRQNKSISGKKEKLARFRINTASDKYQRFFATHIIAQTAPICPATLEMDMAIEALFSLNPEWRAAGFAPTVHDMISHSPMCADKTRIFYMDFVPLDKAETQWHFNIHSVSAATGANDDGQKHAEASIHMRSPSEAAFLQEFGRYERLVSHTQCQALLQQDLDDDGVEVLQGRNVYRAFSEVVEFGQVYRGVRYIVGRDGESAGVVHKRHQGDTWLDVPMNDSFGQVAGIYVNLLTDIPPTDMFVATGCELTMRSPRAQTMTDGMEHGAGVWHVFARHSRQSDKAYMTDVFVFDAATGTLTDIIIGLQYARVAKASMSKILTRLTTDKSFLKNSPVAASSSSIPPPSAAILNNIVETASSSSKSSPVQQRPKLKRTGSKKEKPSERRDLTDDVRNLVSNVSGIEASEMTLDSEMADLGIDSLMGMELAREVENIFKCTLDQGEMMEATSLRQFIALVSNAWAKNGGEEEIGQDGDDGDDDSDDDIDDDRSLAAAEGGDTWSDQSQDDDMVSDISTPDDESNFASGKGYISLPPQAPTHSVSTTSSNLTLSRSDILECFGQVKLLTDSKIREFGLDSIARTSLAGSNRLCVALVVEAFDELGSTLRTAAPGELLERVSFLPQHSRLVKFVYRFLERDARLIDINLETGQLTRTHVAAPRKTSKIVLEELVTAHPESAISNRLAYYAGKHLAGVLSGKTDGIRVIFGSPEGRELVQAMYCDYAFNRMHYQQMAEVVTRLAERLRTKQPRETLKVLEMGGGTGGTTNVMAPLLASLGMPVEYTFTDLSASMVAHARRKFSKQYPFMRFAVHDIEKVPADELRGQHLVLASNAIHATHSLLVSARNVHQALRPDGFLMILEMTETQPFIDIVFGLLEGWWLFDDGREHAIAPTDHWERALHAAGFGHVDWTDGDLPENAFQKVIIALASGPPEPERLAKSVYSHSSAVGKIVERGDVAAREADAERLVAAYTAGWDTPTLSTAAKQATISDTTEAVVIVTGATGSLGSHLVQILADQSNVTTVVCINRRGNIPADERQANALSSRGIKLSPAAHAKLRVYETDASKPQLGLPMEEYAWLALYGTHIIHNAWPMSGTRPLKGFEPQLKTMRNLLDLARDMATLSTRSKKTRIGFQLVSSIGVVGHSAEPRVLEERVSMAAVMPGGYTEAKWVCERMLDETLHQYPRLFRATVTRPGQIAGSTHSGVWNPVEHFAFLVKSAQVLQAWPDLEGILQWIPVDKCAGVMVDLLKIGCDSEAAHPVYHIDNPVGQSWKDMSVVLATALDIPLHHIIPFQDWIKRVRRSPLSETENPVARAVDFLEANFERMSCGGIILDTHKAKEHSETMAMQGPVSVDVARSYISAWKSMGFLH
ncbi:hypothetical protein F5Y04DRAFT_292160 [Hypomontagnella monticulosa]|nr:hypothetical protein F5Y04DRAFT_292160 [Hypomontagnella monticulosa]